jgi:metallophosphoesterase superfamily enzyme
MIKPRHWTREERQRAKDLIEEGLTYKKTAEVLTQEFGHKRTYSMVRRQVRSVNVNANKTIKNFNKKYADFSNKDSSSSSFTEENNYATIEGRFKEKKPPTLQDLLAKFDIDESDWKVSSFKVNQWDVSAKEEVDGKVVWNTHTNYQARATLMRKTPVVCEFPIVQGASVGKVRFPSKPVIKRNNNVDVVVPDSQVGYKRDIQTGHMEPLHDLRAFSIVTKAIKDIKPNRVILLGDMLDLPDWSTHFIHSPEFAFTTQASLDFIASWLKEIRGYCNELIYIEGNHEKRMVDNIVKNTMQAFGIRPANQPEAPPVMSIPYLLGLHDMDIQYVGDYPSGEFYINNNLVCIHGHKVGAKSGQSVTKALDDARISCIFGHIHRLEMAHKTIWTQGKPKIYQAVSLGTIARIDGIVPSGSARHNWQQGFGVVEYDEENFQIDTIGIYEGRAIYRGKVYEC